MKILDCYNLQTAYSSLSRILEVSQSDLRTFVSDYGDPKGHDLEGPERENLVFEEFRRAYDPAIQYDATRWHHLTLLPNEWGFADGLKPYEEVLPKVLTWLGDVAAETVSPKEWKVFQQGIISGEITPGPLPVRAASNEQSGPYGWLIRDFAFYESSKRDYFRRIPEAIEDIIQEADLRFGTNLENQYPRLSSSFIVGFQTEDDEPTNLAAALYYLIESNSADAFSTPISAYTSLSGQAVPRSDLSVEKYTNPPELASLQ